MMKVLVFVSFAAVTNDPNVSVTFKFCLFLLVHACTLAAAELWLGCAWFNPSFHPKTQAEEAEEKARDNHKGSRRFCGFFLLIIH